MKPQSILPTLRRCLALCAMVLTAALGTPAALAQPAPYQSPLISPVPVAKPNILLAYDTSGSMDWGCVYAAHVQPSLGILPQVPGLQVECLAYSDPRQNSPANNYLMYDPGQRYLPGFSASGTLMPTATFSATMNTTIYLPKSGFVPQDSANSFAALSSVTNYNSLTIAHTGFGWNVPVANATSTTNPLPKSPARVDCAGARCTLAEERANLANWYTYHRLRINDTRTALGHVFATRGNTFRLSYTTLVNTSYFGDFPRMTDFELARERFYDWLANRFAIGATPLLSTMNAAGRYFEQIGNAGPWAHTPWAPGTEAPSSHLACRRSYFVLMTDGQWNDLTTLPTADVDGTTWPKILHDTNPQASYQYKPGDRTSTDPRSRGKADSNTTNNITTLADIAMYYWVRDLRGGTPDVAMPNTASPGGVTDPPFWQNMTTYTIGLGISGTLTPDQIAEAKAGLRNWPVPTANQATTVDDLIHAAHNGGGEYLEIKDGTDLINRLGRVLDSISSRSLSEAGVASTAASLTAGARKFKPYYTPGTWWGNLRMIDLDPANGSERGLVWEVTSTDVNGRPTGTTTIPAHDKRKVWVWVDPANKAVEFTETNVLRYGLRSSSMAATTTTLASTNTVDIVNYIRGDMSRQMNQGGTLRTRNSVLGDIVNATPLFIRNIGREAYDRLPDTQGGNTYVTYLENKAARTEGVVFAGANDGMLHGFREGNSPATNGQEVFAYIPRGLLGKLGALPNPSYEHQYYVDGPLVEADAWIATGANPTAWRNLLVGTTGMGSRSVFALNVSNPLGMTGSDVLWEVNGGSKGFEDLGFVNSPVQTGPSPSGKWVAVFGNGVYSASGKAVLYVVDIANGTLVKTLTASLTGDPAVNSADPSTYNGLGGVRIVRNEQQQIIGAYAGDQFGRVWRFDLSSARTSDWNVSFGGKPLFTAKDGKGKAQPISAQPAVVTRNDVNDYKPSYMVIVGTGRLHESTDANVTQTQAVYGLWDRTKFDNTTTSDTIVSGDLAKLTSTVDITASGYYGVTSTVAGGGTRGWVLSLSQMVGQRVIYPIELIDGLARIDTVVPNTTATQACEQRSAQGINYILQTTTGTCRSGLTLDTNRDGQFNEKDTLACGFSAVADGEDVVLAQFSGSAGEGGLRRYAVVSATGSQGICTNCCAGGKCPVPATSSSGRSRSWRQLFLRDQ